MANEKQTVIEPVRKKSKYRLETSLYYPIPNAQVD